jgi:hypothetical protein
MVPAMEIGLAVRALRGLRATLRAAACLLLLSIAADIAIDRSCDSTRLGAASSTLLLSADSRRADEPCVDFCVPDCYCCSRCLVTMTVVPPRDPERFAPVGAHAVEQWPEGVRPVIDHPPPARA